MGETAAQRSAVSAGKPDTEYVAAFAELLVRAVEAGRTPVRQESALSGLQSELRAALEACLNRIGNITLGVDDLDLTHAGQPVYRSAAREGSLTSLLFQDGVREITLRGGITPEELERFVDALRRVTDARARGWDDAVTVLWDGDFQHIAAKSIPAEDPDSVTDASEDGAAGAGASSGVPWPGEGKAEPDEESAADQPLEGEPSVGRADDWLLPRETAPSSSAAGDVGRPFQEIEAENLRMTAAIEEAIPARDQVLAILTELLRVEREPEAFVETASVLGLFIEQAIVEGDFARASQFSERLRAICAGRPEDPEALTAVAEQVIQSAGRAEILREVTPLLNADTDVDLNALAKLLASLGSEAAPTLCDLLCEVQVKRVRRAICEALVISCKSDVGVLIRQLSDSRWYVVRNVLYVLGRIAHQGVERALGEALFHEDIRVRREAICALAEVDSPRGRAYLNSALRDPDKGIRILVAQLISRRRSDRAAGVIWSVIESTDFDGRDPEERAAFFAALGRTGSDALVPRLTASLTRGARPRPADRIDRREAALALAWLGTPAALDVLRREAGNRRDEVRAAVAAALADLRRAAPRDHRTDWGR